MFYKLTATEGDQSFELRRGTPLIVGRALNSDIPVFDPTISRRHAELVIDDAGVNVTDLGSSNGTYLNGEKIDAGKIAPGDTITFGKVAFKLSELRPSVQISPIRDDAPPRPPADFGGAPPKGGTIVRQMPQGLSREKLVEALRAEEESAAGAVATATATDVDRNANKLRLLLEVSKGLTRIVDTNALLDQIAGYCFDILDIDRTSIALMDENGGITPRVSRDRRGSRDLIKPPGAIVREAVRDKVAILTDEAATDSRFEGGGGTHLVQQVLSAMCVPLIASENRVLGVLYVDTLLTMQRVSGRRFDESDLEFVVAFAGIAAVAIENQQFSERMRREMLARSNFERYFSPNLAAQIASNQDATKLRGDKRTVAVLFSDIRGFTALSETMNPDDMANLLTEYFTEMVECVFRNGGTLDKFIGDAVMAQWGAPIATPDDPDKAMRAGIEMIQELDKLNAKWTKEGRPTLQIGIGINYGEAFAGNIGSERRLEFTVIGDTVNTASRLCGAAEGREILISEEFRRVLKSPPKLEQREPIPLKGKAQPVPVYSVAV